MSSLCLQILIETLNKHGFSSSYAEEHRYKRCASMNQGLDIPGFPPGKFVQYVADNVDHDIRTTDGCDTFHGMGSMDVSA